MKYEFKKGNTGIEDFEYVYFPISKEYATFTQEEDCLRNDKGVGFKGEDYIDGYQYITLMHKQFFKNVKVKTHCTFEKFGAPLITITGEIAEKDGYKRFGTLFEVVAYEKGCNVWYIAPDASDLQRGTKNTLIATKKFALKGGEMIELAVEIQDKKIIVKINGEDLEVEHEALPKSYRVGFTGCEGINRFYDFEVEE